MNAQRQTRGFDRPPLSSLGAGAGAARWLGCGLRFVTRAGAVCGLVLGASMSSAWDGAVTGTIRVIEVTAGNNFAFRVSLSGVGAHCSGGAAWAFLNDTDSNYKTYVAALLMASSLNRTVTLYTTNEGGYCRIGHIGVNA